MNKPVYLVFEVFQSKLYSNIPKYTILQMIIIS